MAGLSKLEQSLVKESERLKGENNFLKALLQDVGEHLIDLVNGQDGEDDEWMCRCCGARASLNTDTRNMKDYPHEQNCALYVI